MDQICDREVSVNAHEEGLAKNIKRIWFYETKPVNALTFMAVLSSQT
jgi:hypothetical protein